MRPTRHTAVVEGHRWGRWALPTILVTFAVLAGLYSLVTPVFEGPDEIWHFAYANYLANNGGLPVLSIDHPDLWLRNSAHPPLYYWPLAALIAPLDRTDFPSAFRFNLASPNITPGAHSDRPNLLIHGRNEDFPFRQSVLAVHLGRLLSIALGVVTLVGVWAVARQLAPGNGTGLPLATVAVAAFVPQFVYGSGVINNDALAVASGTWTLAALLALMRSRSLRWAVLAGLALGIALLSKIGMVALLPLPVAALILANTDLLPWHNRVTAGEWRLHWRARLIWAVKTGLVLYAIAGLAAGWWYLRNWTLYGDPLAWRLWQVLAGVGRPFPSISQFLSDMAGLFGTYWADFGVRADRQWTWAFAGLVLVATAGLVWRIIRRDWPALNWAGLALSAASFALLLASAVRYSLVITDIHGRLIHPALAATSFWLVVGLTGWGARFGRWLAGAVVAGLFATTLLVPFLVINPAYARPLVAGHELPGQATAASAAFGGAVELAGFELPSSHIRPGASARFVTFWRTLAVRPGVVPDTVASLALVRPDGTVLGHAETLLGTSVYPSAEWLPTDLVVATTDVTIPVGVAVPTIANVWLTVRGDSGGLLPTGQGDVQDLGRVALSGGAGCSPTVSTTAIFGGQIRLIGYSLDANGLTLCWSALQTISDDYTVFVHVLDQQGRSLSNADSQPRAGQYPTSAWLPGELIEDRHPLVVPAGATIQVGLYKLDTLERLSLGSSGETELALIP